MRFLTISVLSVSGLLASRSGDLREHTRAATNIVLGEVTGNRSYYGSDGDVYSDVTINVSASLKDTSRKAARLRTFTVKGGTVGGTSVMFTDVPTFELNESVVVFFEGDVPSEKYALRGGWVPELGERAGKVLGDIEQTLQDLDSPIAESERHRARAFLTEMAEAPAPADGACYALIGPKWTESFATYKIGSTIPAAWKTALEASATSWNRAGTPFAFRADAASTNEFTLGAVTGATTLASTRIEYDSTNRMRRFSMTFSSAVSWSPTGEAGKFDVESVTAHELGHALGLNHPSGTACSEQTMWASAASGELKKRTLENGDKAGLAQLYAVTTPTPTPTPAPAPTPTPSTLPAAPAPVLTTAAFFPPLPKAGQEFAVWLVGSGFDPATVQTVVNGPSCPTPCVSSLPYRTASFFSGVIGLGTKGAHTIAIRNGPTGALSAAKPLMIQ